MQNSQRGWITKLSFVITFIIGFIVGSFVCDSPNQHIQNVPIIDTITIRDSLYFINDSITERIIYLDKNYEEDVDNILSNSDSANLCLFTEYLNNYNNKRTVTND